MTKYTDFLKRSLNWINRKLYKVQLFCKFGFGHQHSFEQLANFTNKKTYEYFEFMFHYRIPKSLIDHRLYFQANQRGFGEAAFHAAWHEVFRTYRPQKNLEIGVYRGQTISLWALCVRHFLIEGSEIWGLTPLINLGDTKSTYLDIDYRSDINENFKYFNLPLPNILKSNSESQEAKDFIKREQWDLIYIDGGHNYETVLNDYLASKEGLRVNGILVFDDSSLYMNYSPKKNRFAGHPGPSKVLMDFALKDMDHLLTVGHLNFLRKR